MFKTPDKGWLQLVIAKWRSDTEQIKRIQAHLRKISSEFAARRLFRSDNYSGPGYAGSGTIGSDRA